MRDENGQFMPGNTLGHGRPRGCLNKLTEVKQRVVDTLDKLDKKSASGDWLADFAEEYPREFVRLLASILAKNLNVLDETSGGHNLENLQEIVARLRREGFPLAGGLIRDRPLKPKTFGCGS